MGEHEAPAADELDDELDGCGVEIDDPVTDADLALVVLAPDGDTGRIEAYERLRTGGA